MTAIKINEVKDLLIQRNYTENYITFSTFPPHHETFIDVYSKHLKYYVDMYTKNCIQMINTNRSGLEHIKHNNVIPLVYRYLICSMTWLIPLI